MKKLTGALILLISLTLTLGALIFTVSAQSESNLLPAEVLGEESYATLGQAIDAAPDGGTVILNGNVNVNSTLNITKSVTVDLNGYSLISEGVGAVFYINASGVEFTVTGDGVIEIDGALVKTDSVLENTTVNVKGKLRGITVDHSGTASPSLTYTRSGIYNFENLTVNTVHTGSQAFYSPNNAVSASDGNVTVEKNLEINFKGCEITAVTSTVSNELFFVPQNGIVNFDYCTVTTTGSLFKLENHKAITSYNSDGSAKTTTAITNYMGVCISARNSSFVATSSRSTFSATSSELCGDIVFDHTYCSYYSSCLIKHNYVVNKDGNRVSTGMFLKNGSAIEFKSSAVMMYSMHVSVDSASAIIYPDANTSALYSKDPVTNQTSTGNFSGRGLILNEGALISVGVYNAVAVNGKTNGVTFSDLKKPTSVDAGYKFRKIYDSRFGAEMYEVVSLSSAFDTEIFSDGSELEYENQALGTLTYFDSALWPKVIWNPQRADLYPVYTGNSGNKALMIEKNNSGSSSPEYFFGSESSIKTASNAIIVLDFDFASGNGDEISDGNVYVNARTGSTPIGGTDKKIKLFGISGGKAVSSSDSVISAEAALSKTDWNHCTAIVDTANSTVYLYLNGVKVGEKTVSLSASGLGVFGIRYVYSSSTYTTFLFDNMLLRAQGVKSLTNIEGYLSNSGKTFNSGAVGGYSRLEKEYGYEVGGFTVDISDITVSEGENKLLTHIPHVIEDGTPIPSDIEGVISTEGKRVVFEKTTVPFANIYDNEGNRIGVEMNKKYAEYTLNVNFYNGKYENPSEVDDPDLFTSAAIKFGTYALEGLDLNPYAESVAYINGRDYYLSDFDGSWTLIEENTVITDKEHLGAELALKYEGKTLHAVPNYSEQKSVKNGIYKVIVLDPYGAFKSAYSDNSAILKSIWGEDHLDFSYGETAILLSDVEFADTCSPTRSGARKKVFSVDLNGYSVTARPDPSKKSFEFFSACDGEAWNIYSSFDGSVITDMGSVSTPENVYGSAFVIVGSFGDGDSIGDAIVSNSRESTDNTEVNIGMGKGKLEINSGVIVNAVSGDTSCEINIDGVRAVRSAYYNHGECDNEFIVAQAYSGKINIENSTLILAAGGYLINSPRQYAEAGAENTDNSDHIGESSQAEVSVYNCVIIMRENGAELIRDNYAFLKISFTDCVTNGSINHSQRAVVSTMNTAAAEIGADAVSGYSNVKYFVPMTLSGVTEEQTASATYQYVENSEVKTATFTVAPYGFEGEANLTLPLLAEKSVEDKSVVTVTFAGIGENPPADVVDYAIGGFVQPTDKSVESYVGNALKFTFESYTLPTEPLSEDVVLTPEYDVAVAVKGIKTNLSIYSDFGVNLLIPKAYDEYVSVSFGTETLEKSYVTFDGAEYVSVTVRRDVKDVKKNVVFDVTVTEGATSVKKSAIVNIVNYATAILTDTADKYTVADKTLMYYMIAYANEAVKYITSAENYDTELSAIVSNEDYKSALAKYEVSEYKYVITETGLSGALASAGVQLTSSPNFIFELKEGFKGTIEVSYGSNTKITLADASVSKWVIVDDIRVYNFASLLDVTVKDSEGNVVASGNYNLDTFVSYHVNNALDEDSSTREESARCLNLLRAFYNYVSVANQYKAGTLAT